MKLKQVQINNHYGMHGVHRNIQVYEMTTDRCSASPMEGYKGTEVTLVDQPAWNEKFSAWQVTGANVTGNNLILNNDVTAKAVYETAKNLTLQTDGHGSIASTRMSGFIGDQATLSNTPNEDYTFSAYTITGATLTGNKFNFNGANVTAKAWFKDTSKELLADTNQWDIWVPKRATSLNPTVDRIGCSFDNQGYRYIVYCVNCTFMYDGIVSVRPNTPQSFPAINTYWHFRRYNNALYCGKIARGSNANYTNNIVTWHNGAATNSASIGSSDGDLDGTWIQCSDFYQYPSFKLILDRNTSQCSAYYGYGSNADVYQGYADVATTANATQLQAECNADENAKVNAKVRIYGCTTFDKAAACRYS